MSMCREVRMNTKPSMTLRFLESREVFTLDEFMTAVDPGVSERTRETNLRNAVKREQARRLARGLYASNVGVFRDKTPNVLLVASKAAPDSVLVYHTALEAHGVAHTPARTVYLSLIHISEPTRLGMISYAVFCLKKKKKRQKKQNNI